MRWVLCDLEPVTSLEESPCLFNLVGEQGSTVAWGRGRSALCCWGRLGRRGLRSLKQGFQISVGCHTSENWKQEVPS